MEENCFDHKIMKVNGINIHIVEKGQGPIILFIHGFPELWYSWRNQISFMAKNGYRAMALDLPGFGDTTGVAKDDPSKFNILRVVGDLVELLNTIVPKEEKVFVVGHDWGALIAWNLCLFRPDKVKALVNLSVPFSPRNPKRKPIETLKAIYGDDYYVVRFQIVEKGQGPIILFIHGFPELWYSWRNQISFMAKNGYRAMALDLPGFGDTTGVAKDDPSKFNILRVVGDLVELLNTIVPKEEKVFVVGHDWGALIAWNLCLFRPDKVKALVNLSVPFSPRNPKRKPIETLKAIYGDDYYVVRFQEPGVIETEFAKTGTKKVLEKFFTYRNPGPLYMPKGKPFDDSPVILPSWLSEKEVDYYAKKYEETGFTGGLNYYRAIDLNWELTAAWTGAQVKVPVKFIVGDLDLTYNAPGVKDYINKGGMKKDVPLLEKVVILENVGHFLQQEKSDEINQQIHDFFKGFSST